MKNFNQRRLLVILITVYVLLIAPAIAMAQPEQLSLREVLAIAAKQNRQLLLRRLEQQKQEQTVSEAKSFRRPQVAVAASYSYNFDRQVIFTPASFAGEASNRIIDIPVGGKHAFNSTVMARQSVYDPVLKREIGNSKLRALRSALEVQEAGEDLALEVSVKYWSLFLLQVQIQTIRQSLIRNEQALSTSRNLFLNGRALRSDTLTTFINVQNLGTDLVRLQNEYKATVLELGQLLAAELSPEMVLTDSVGLSVSSGSNMTLEALVAHAQSQRTDVRMHSMDLLLSRNELKRNAALFQPQISLVGMYQVQAQADDPLNDSYRLPRSSFAGIQVSLPIYAGNRSRIMQRRARMDLAQRELRLKELSQAISVELARLTDQHRELQDAFAKQDTKDRAAEINHRIAKERYRNGVATLLELEDAEMKLTETKLQRHMLQFRLKVNEMELLHAAGVLKL